MKTSSIVAAFLEQMHQAGQRLTVRSITRRLASAGLRVQVWRRASVAEVMQAWSSGKSVAIPNSSPMGIGAGTGIKWDATSFTAGASFYHKLERLRVELLLLDWKPKGTTIICDL